MTNDERELLTKKAIQIRKLILEMCSKAGTGHVTSAFSSVEMLVALFYGGLLRYNPNKPDWADRDRFILSKGQASVLLYPVLADVGFFPLDNLDGFCQKDGKFGVHLQHDVPGAEIISGSLGHGIGIATGMALAAKMDRKLNLVFTLVGDGECYEGSVWEAAMFASHQRLNNLVAIVDRNHLCVTNFTENMLVLEPLVEKWESFGWNAFSIDGHDFEDIFKVMKWIRCRRSHKPTVIIAHTVKGKGVSFLCNDPIWHGASPTGENAACALDEIC